MSDSTCVNCGHGQLEHWGYEAYGHARCGACNCPSYRPRSEVVSEPGAAITVERMNLTDDEKESLTVTAKIPARPEPEQTGEGELCKCGQPWPQRVGFLKEDDWGNKGEKWQRRTCRSCGNVEERPKPHLEPFVVRQLRQQNAALTAQVVALKKELVAANKGAQTNAKVNQLLVEHLAESRAQVAAYREALGQVGPCIECPIGASLATEAERLQRELTTTRTALEELVEAVNAYRDTPNDPRNAGRVQAALAKADAALKESEITDQS